MPCSCRQVQYCSAKCRTAHNPVHREGCPVALLRQQLQTAAPGPIPEVAQTFNAFARGGDDAATARGRIPAELSQVMDAVQQQRQATAHPSGGGARVSGRLSAEAQAAVAQASREQLHSLIALLLRQMPSGKGGSGGWAVRLEALAGDSNTPPAATGGAGGAAAAAAAARNAGWGAPSEPSALPAAGLGAGSAPLLDGGVVAGGVLPSQQSDAAGAAVATGAELSQQLAAAGLFGLVGSALGGNAGDGAGDEQQAGGLDDSFDIPLPDSDAADNALPGFPPADPAGTADATFPGFFNAEGAMAGLNAGGNAGVGGGGDDGMGIAGSLAAMQLRALGGELAQQQQQRGSAEDDDAIINSWKEKLAMAGHDPSDVTFERGDVDEFAEMYMFEPQQTEVIWAWIQKMRGQHQEHIGGLSEI